MDKSSIGWLCGVKRVHFMGIGGVGMSALALLLSDMGYEVSGCDLSRSVYFDALEKKNIPCRIGHSVSHIDEFSPQLLTYSNAVHCEQEELAAADVSGVMTMGRGELLSLLFNASFGVGVAGAHGKTTTSSMIGMILERLGFDPTLAIGAEVRDIGVNAKTGKSGLFVAEIDESDGSFEFFTPSVTVITNIDWDHVDHFKTREDLLEAFVRFADALKTGGSLIVCAEDVGNQSMLSKLKCRLGVVTCGFGRGWDWGAFDLTPGEKGGVSFSVARESETLGRIDLSVSGEHNVLNALMSCAAVFEVISILKKSPKKENYIPPAVSFDDVAKAMSVFRGAERRLERVGVKKSVDIIDDYGHHPTEISASLSAVRDMYRGRRLVVIFQPHRYTRTKAFYREIAEALSEADVTLLLPVYSAGEESCGVTSQDILSVMNILGSNAILCRDEEDVLSRLDSILLIGDVLLTLGAGSVTKLGKKYLEKSL
ncbi:UDP-N-acetylmuramate--L-alanine ligase [Synergistales bacterium]|nr:UDP-N-acetylmuramate--L-alanine ligase [Synergistales bacterium]